MPKGIVDPNILAIYLSMTFYWDQISNYFSSASRISTTFFWYLISYPQECIWRVFIAASAVHFNTQPNSECMTLSLYMCLSHLIPSSCRCFIWTASSTLELWSHKINFAPNSSYFSSMPFSFFCFSQNFFFVEDMWRQKPKKGRE